MLVSTRLVLAGLVSSTLSVVACGGADPKVPAPGDGPAPTTTAASPTGAAVDGAPAAGDPAAGAKKARKPFSIHSSCPDVATILFGEDPKAAGAGRRTVASNSAIDGPRDDDGKQTVWLLDDKGEPLVKVRVTRGMKEVEIGRSCRTLDAH